ncbi:CDP-alcohol phosphatidyltransferase family protein [Frigoribacterium sp. VKM Ac-2836]|uniref:CDP-alcohol phosphatidyltransferase family protein n=1 Tax=Frigoribacterium sp. VKM Ac-2836 TaxID=2739014 RepID=UPI001565B4F3|nr:CDP-alcohol phosphatidyltransferase family protein [Frigoribacterium sp. VKM Ac-2836]NRD26944.1 VTT domain-containing protein [Frigoribacterium sp. VKM Ac-2836]
MDLIGWITDVGSSLPTPLVWALGALFSFTESGLGLGVFVPGETIVLLLAATFDSPWPAVAFFVSVAIGGSLGDHVGYLLGRRFGTGFRDTRIIRKIGVDSWDRAVAVLERRGAAAVFLTRLVPVVRTLTPAAAGVAKVPYRSFLPASFGGALTWAAVYVGIGFLLRSSLEAAQEYLGQFSSWALIGAAVIVAIVFVVRLVRRRRAAAADAASGASTGAVDETVAADDRTAGADAARADTSDEEARADARGPVSSVVHAAGHALADPVVAGASASGEFVAEHLSSRRLGALRHRLFEVDDWRTVPNAITAARLLLLPVFAGLLIAELWWPALVVIGVVFATDWLDGFVARRTDSVSVLGSWLDPVADRLTVVVVAVAFATADVFGWQEAVLLLVPDVLLAIGAVLAFRGDPAVPVWWAGRLRTGLCFVGLAVLLLGVALDGPEWTGVIGVGYLVFLVGLVFHYVSAVHYARVMLVRWQRAIAERPA